MSEENRLIDEQSAKKVLERALELDEAKHGAFSVEQLRDVARDMAISPSSIEQALEEQRHELQAMVQVPSASRQPESLQVFGQVNAVAPVADSDSSSPATAASCPAQAATNKQ